MGNFRFLATSLSVIAFLSFLFVSHQARFRKTRLSERLPGCLAATADSDLCPSSSIWISLISAIGQSQGAVRAGSCLAGHGPTTHVGGEGWPSELDNGFSGLWVIGGRFVLAGQCQESQHSV
ncbi:hypothetical protein QBC34DRAFT_60121 [Podospora aff. communis PSN243]|uniref:Uncharacterized protein n=1 Tax=Podospora aff. communis PSN243 TaxID=3040156 RepID=A0AAV9GRF0_9PEZI|nr:hypothetical protein QBC34DRAFT_60121 [Podospora aff. communis PSN243]